MGVLEDKVALVTGSTRGIGKAVAEAFSREGAQVIVNSRSQRDSKNLAAQLGKKFARKTLGVRGNLSVATDVKDMFKEVRKSFGRIDVLVNNAGFPMLPERWNHSFIETKDTEFREVLEVDLMGTIRCCREALVLMKDQRRGVIINVSSTPALAGYNRGAAYTVAKAAILGLTRHLAYEYGRFSIRVNSLALGNISTPEYFNSLSEEEKETLGKEAPLRRWGTPNDIAGACLFLASDISSFITGQTLVVDGGTVMR